VTTFREYRQGGDAVPEDAALRSMPKEARDLQGERAGFVSRVLAAGIDVVLVFLVVLGTVALVWMLSFLINPVSVTTPAVSGDGARIPQVGAIILYGYFLNWLYWTVCWATSGRTLGNLVMGLKVVNFRGKHMSWGGAAVRSLFCTTFPIGLLWVVVSGANRSVQDVVIRSSVMYDWVLKAPNLADIFSRHEAKSKEKAP
jgi:uncharacterized RDD family membrane protein YckC